MKGNTLAIILLVVGLIVGGGVGYFAAPRQPADGDGDGDGGPQIVEVLPLDGQTVQLGYIESNTVNLEQSVPHIQEIIEPDINDYLAKLGYDMEIEFLIDDATGQQAVHLEKVQGFKSIGVNIFIGGAWSSQAKAALSYCNDNDMLMWSASSTDPTLGIPDDNLYRMCPTDRVQGPAISRMLLSHGIKAVIVIQRGDSWADGLYNFFTPDFEANGGVVLERIRYAAETQEFSSYLQQAENVMKDAVAEYGEEHCAVEVIGFQETAVMLTQVEDFPTLWGVWWFGSDGTAVTNQIEDEAGEPAEHLGVYSTLAAPAETVKYTSIAERFESLTNIIYGYYRPCTYDISWVLTETILETQSTDALDVIPLQATTCFNNFGASGWNRLNEDGDRAKANYYIYTYRIEGGECDSVVVGIYDWQTDEVTWYPEILGYTPEPL
jgi:branched-chain amino acid transport system substrate-binding protein